MTAEANAEQRDHLMQETCVRALAHKDQWQPATHLTCWIFRVAQNLWFDQNRAEKFRGKPVEMETADYLVGREESAVTERRLVLAELLRALDQLSPEHLALIGLVSVCGLTNAEAAEILSLPIRTVMRRVARGSASALRCG
jgi:RNA polymerase sigma-70 factor (ECF subfamily)